jgi:Methylase involved in ubiquinone/menaquinone biosynthesis
MKGDDRESYLAFAYAYDQALGSRFFDSVAPILDEVSARYPASAASHLDLACGTGLALQHLAAKGFTATGVDASIPMLRIAAQRAARLVAADLRALPFRGTFGRVTCLYDSLNHLLHPRDLEAAFREARRVMNHDSIFLFDMNHPDAYPRIWGTPEPFVAEAADSFLSMETSFSRRTKLGRAHITGWAVVGGKKIAIDEVHQQRAYARSEIVAALRNAHLEPVEIRDFNPFDETDTRMRRVKVKFVFLARVI